jgi:hypothetical protein
MICTVRNIRQCVWSVYLRHEWNAILHKFGETTTTGIMMAAELYFTSRIL